MSGRHSWRDIKRHISDEDRARVDAKVDALRATLPPRTYDQVLWAAVEYEKGAHQYNSYYREVYNGDYRAGLLDRCSESDAKFLLQFLNQWKSRRPANLVGVIASTLPTVVRRLGPTLESALDDADLDDEVFLASELAFDTLISLQHVGPTTASKILGVLNPQFFVMWDGPIQQLYFHWEKRNGHAYSLFMEEMRNSALSIVADADKKGVLCPADAISNEICQQPPFTLAKFINDYVWLTVTKKERYSVEWTAQENYA